MLGWNKLKRTMKTANNSFNAIIVCSIGKNLLFLFALKRKRKKTRLIMKAIIIEKKPKNRQKHLIFPNLGKSTKCLDYSTYLKHRLS